MNIDKFDLMYEKMLAELDKDYNILTEEVTNTGVDEVSSGDQKEKVASSLRSQREKAIAKNKKVIGQIKNFKMAKNAGIPVNNDTEKALDNQWKQSIIDKEDKKNAVRQFNYNSDLNLEEELTDEDIYTFAEEFEDDFRSLSEDEKVLKARIKTLGNRRIEQFNNQKEQISNERDELKDSASEAKQKIKEDQMKEKQDQQLKQAEEMQKQADQSEKLQDANAAERQKVEENIKKEKEKMKKQIDQVDRLSNINQGGENTMEKNTILAESKASRLDRQHEKIEKKWQNAANKKAKASSKINDLEKKRDELSKKASYLQSKGKSTEHIAKKIAKLNSKIELVKGKFNAAEAKYQSADDAKSRNEFKRDTLTESLNFDLDLLLNEEECIYSELCSLLEEVNDIIDNMTETNNPVEYKQESNSLLESKKQEIVLREYSDPMLKHLSKKINEATDAETLAKLIMKFNEYNKNR